MNGGSAYGAVVFVHDAAPDLELFVLPAVFGTYNLNFRIDNPVVVWVASENGATVSLEKLKLLFFTKLIIAAEDSFDNELGEHEVLKLAITLGESESVNIRVSLLAEIHIEYVGLVHERADFFGHI